MIPTSFLSRLSLPSPQQTERDLARLIHRTIELDRRANRQLGYAAVNIGCDGVRRVTMFDGSNCQTSGDVCLATREEGITVCLDTPSGAGLAFQRITFAAPACAPVTGWWLLDSEGYMYRVPASLITAAPYWPMTADPAVPEPAVTLVRAGTWARLMCGGSITPTLNSRGGSSTASIEEGTLVFEQFYCAAGPRGTYVKVIPAVTLAGMTLALAGGMYGVIPTDDYPTGEMPMADGSAWYFAPMYITSDTFPSSDANGDPLEIGDEYQATIGGTGDVTIGVKAAEGSSVAPSYYRAIRISSCLFLR